MNSPLSPGDIVELPGGRRLMVVRPERAAQICKDVQLWWFDCYTLDEWRKDHTPTYFHSASGIQWIPADFPHLVAIEIAPPKEEYTPNE